jgi:polysaccharide export outer membrane protein
MKKLIFFLTMCAALVGGGAFLSAAAAPETSAPAPVTAPPLADYKLGAGDKVRILVYNEPNLTGEYTVNSAGLISFPLIGDVNALNRTTVDVRAELEQKLGSGYLRTPQVSIDVLSYRPFFILGEVNKPGDYPYSAGLTVLRAVATAEGFTYRADQRHVYLKHSGDSKETRYSLDSDIVVQPGDTLRIGERYF